MEQSKAMEYGSRKVSADVVKPHYIYNSCFVPFQEHLPTTMKPQLKACMSNKMTVSIVPAIWVCN